MKKIVSIALTLIMLLSAFAMAEEAEQTIELGTSGITMIVDASYVKGEITADDTTESQVAYYVSENTLVDFDIYQWAKAEGETLATVAAEEAAEFGAECTETEINGIAVMYYEATEESEGTEYTTTTFIMENGDFFAEIVFWMDGDSANDEVEAMIDTLAIAETAEVADEGNVITLGTSALAITLPFNYEKGEITAEDTDENQVAYYFSNDTLVDFDVYQWAKAEGETLETAIAEEAAEFTAEAATTEINGITIAYYNATEESEGTEYNTVTFMMEDGDNFVEIVFWLDGENATDIVDGIIGTIAR